jgi:GDP-D-mannose dehydratase
VYDVVKSVLKILELPESTMINEDKSRLASTRHNVQLVGDTQKLTACTGWKATMELDDIIGEMIDAKLEKGIKISRVARGG